MLIIKGIHYNIIGNSVLSLQIFGKSKCSKIFFKLIYKALLSK